jgi:hypothetical protein
MWGEATFGRVPEPFEVGFEILENPARFRIDDDFVWVVENVREKLSFVCADDYLASEPVSQCLDMREVTRTGFTEMYNFEYNAQRREHFVKFQFLLSLDKNAGTMNLFIKAPVGTRMPALDLFVNDRPVAAWAAQEFSILAHLCGRRGIPLPDSALLFEDELRIRVQPAARGRGVASPGASGSPLSAGGGAEEGFRRYMNCWLCFILRCHPCRLVGEILVWKSLNVLFQSVIRHYRPYRITSLSRSRDII